jgi:hypothetical protein
VLGNFCERAQRLDQVIKTIYGADDERGVGFELFVVGERMKLNKPAPIPSSDAAHYAIAPVRHPGA